MIVDYQCHWLTRKRFEELLDRPAGSFPRAERHGDGYRYWVDAESGDYPWTIHDYYCDLDLQLADMDANGVDVALMAPTVFGEVAELDLAEAKDILALVNEESARAVRESPQRRRGLAMLPMQDAAAAIETLDDAIGRLGLSGVSMISNVAGRPLAHEETMPIFERIAELDVPVVLHPAMRSFVYDRIAEIGRAAEVGLAWMFETSAAALSLIYSGALDRCPNLTVIHPHLGGTLPYLRARFETVHQIHGLGDRTLEEYLRGNFYADTANLTPGAIEMAADAYGSDRILFATDHPWVPREQTTAQLAAIEPGLAERIRSNQIPGLDLPER